MNRSTKASAAIDRLKRRSGDNNYSMIMSHNGLFSLVLPTVVADTETLGVSQASKSNRLCEPLPIDEFVAFVNAYGPQTPKRVSQLEVAFTQQLANSKAKADKT